MAANKRRDNDEEPEADSASGSPESSNGKSSNGESSNGESSNGESRDEQNNIDEPAEVGAVDDEEPEGSADAASLLSDEDQALLDSTAADLVAEMRSDMLRAQAELVNFRTRVERDRVANRESVIAEVIRTLLPALDDLTRAEKHGDLAGSPLELVGAKIRAAFDRYGLRSVGEAGEVFDPHLHEAVVQLPSPGVTVNTVADVIEPGYALGDRLIRAAKVAVSVPE
jgi:molecular chaperone GrpE